MRKTLLLTLLLVPMAAIGQVRGTVLNDLLRKPNVGVLDAAAAMVIADAVGLNAQTILQETRPYNVTVWDAGPGWWIARESRRPFPTIYEMHRRGKGWGVIAHEMGIHPGTFNKMRKSGEFGSTFWPDLVILRGIPDSDYRLFRNKGLSDREILLASALGNLDRDRTRTIVNERVNRGWFDVPSRGRVKPSSLGSSSSGKGKVTKSKGGGSAKGSSWKGSKSNKGGNSGKKMTSDSGGGKGHAKMKSHGQGMKSKGGGADKAKGGHGKGGHGKGGHGKGKAK